LGDARPHVPLAIDSGQGFQELPKDKPFAVIGRIQCVRQLDRLAQHNGERLGLGGGVRGEAALVWRLKRNWGEGRRLRSAADQREQENAAPRGRR
jgi:hypothetical protein